jgi:hypothetical protein
MSISAQLRWFKSEQAYDNKEAKDFCMESPFQRTKREVQLQLAESQKYRASILKNVATFGTYFASYFSIVCLLSCLLSTAGLSPEAIITAAQSMEEVFFKKGDVIIEQDDIGESFFVLEEGRVSVTVGYFPSSNGYSLSSLLFRGRPTFVITMNQQKNWYS